jgi:hypothetical protein
MGLPFEYQTGPLFRNLWHILGWQCRDYGDCLEKIASKVLLSDQFDFDELSNMADKI